MAESVQKVASSKTNLVREVLLQRDPMRRNSSASVQAGLGRDEPL